MAAVVPPKNTEADFPGFRVTDLEVGELANFGSGKEEPAYETLLVRAKEIERNRLSFFSLNGKDLGDPIDWSMDHEHGKHSPLKFSSTIDYRDFRITGDAKVVWEPNRHHQLVLLGRAYRASGDCRYAETAVRQMESWMNQCPFGKGMNWRSPLELAIRLINWVWALDLIRESGLVKGEFRERVLHSVYLHLWEITRKYSRGSSANNHLIGEAAGVFIGSSYFRNLPDTSRWIEESHAILSREIEEQTYADGLCREQAMGYHLFVLQFFLYAGIVGQRAGREFPASYWARIEKMMEFLGALIEGGPLPMFGDADDGYVLDLGNPCGDPLGLLSTGAVMFSRKDFAALSNGYAEQTIWLLGPSSKSRFDSLKERQNEELLRSHEFPGSGYYLLQCGKKEDESRISVFFDCGELGFRSIAAHGHADALSFTLRVSGEDVFVDPGTYDYFTYPEWRKYFRSTRAHNTVEVDGVDQSVILGPFIWGKRAASRCLRWEHGDETAIVVGEHDGYQRLDDPVTHRRSIELNSVDRLVTVRDFLKSEGAHKVAILFHLSEHCYPRQIGNRIEISVRGNMIYLESDPSLIVSLLQGSENPIGGWISRGYHRKTATTMIECRGKTMGETELISRIRIVEPTESRK
jgi:hypothetical protein